MTSPESEAIMKACMTSETYDGCPIKKCKACPAKKDCDKDNWIRLGGIAA
jgi:hypothetical protein